MKSAEIAMISSKAEAEAALVARSYPKVFLDIYSGDFSSYEARVGRWLRIIAEPPDRYFADVQKRGGARMKAFCEGYLPLWESNGEQLVAEDVIRGGFYRYYYEDVHDAKLVDSYQQFVTRILLESGLDASGRDLETFCGLAKAFEYHHLDHLLQFLSQPIMGEYEVAWTEFIMSISD